MKIAIASDHAGYELKSILIEEFKNNADLQLIDLGCDNAKTSVDYPDYANKLVQKLLAKEVDSGILVCGSGIGISIAANRFKGIRAALCQDANVAKLSRQHNDANIICFGGRIIDPKEAIAAVKVFLNTDFQGGRHSQRVEKLG